MLACSLWRVIQEREPALQLRLRDLMDMEEMTVGEQIFLKLDERGSTSIATTWNLHTMRLFCLSIVTREDEAHLGLGWMRVRVAKFRGRLQIESQLGAGPSIYVWIPL